MKLHNRIFTLKVDRLFEYINNVEKTYQGGEIRFKNCELALCDVLIFNKTLERGNFTGKNYSLEEFLDRYKEAEFDIRTDSYCRPHTTYWGELWEGEEDDQVSFMLYIRYYGEIEYCTNEGNG